MHFGPLAQLVEQQTLNLEVRGSIPRRLINFSPEKFPLFSNAIFHSENLENSMGKWKIEVKRNLNFLFLKTTHP